MKVIDTAHGGRSIVRLDEYADLLSVRTLPNYSFTSENTVEVDTEKLALIGHTSDAAAHEWPELAGHLFDYQRWLTSRALTVERFAVFAMTGTGKTAIQLEWARQISDASGRVLVVAPLSVVSQTLNEWDKFYPTEERPTDLTAREDLDAWRRTGVGIGITNYEKFDGNKSQWDIQGVVLDESSMLRGMGTRKQGVVAAFAGTRYKLCCSATPAPNDRDEYADHAAFLGVVRRPLEYLARYFRNTGNTSERWEFKPHSFDAWMNNLCSWAVYLRDPERWGFQSEYQVPELVEYFPSVDLTDEQRIRGREFEAGDQPSLFGATPGGIVSRTKVAQISNGFEITDDGVDTFDAFKPADIVGIVESHPDEQVIVWTKYQREAEQLGELIGGSVVLTGKTNRKLRETEISAFAAGTGARVLVAMQSMFSHGLNLQTCGVQVFSTQDDSFERRFQAVRRSLRFGRTEPVTVYTPITDLDRAACENVLAKAAVFEHDSSEIETQMIERINPMTVAEEAGQPQHPDEQYEMDRTESEEWTMVHADSLSHMTTMEPESVDLAVFSPPFASLFVYSSMLGDMGNNSGKEEFGLQWRWFAERMLPIIKPGRVVAVHCQDTVVAKFSSGEAFQHLADFPGQLAAGMVDAGFLYTGRVTIDKCPQAQAIRTNSQALMFNQLRRNSLNSRPALADYLLLFRAPGEPEEIVQPPIENPEWVEWARPIWYDIRESDTLNTLEAKEVDEERHICPLQIGLIDRAVTLWSNPGDLVFSPFAGIGSEGWSSLGLGRRFYGVELKESYYETAVRNLGRRIEERNQTSMELSA